MAGWRVREARHDDAEEIARVHVGSWRETYRGSLVTDDVLDDPELLPRRVAFWRAALTDSRWAANRIAVAEHDGALVGIAMSGPVDGDERTHLHVLYLLAEHHGTGAGAALLDAVLEAADPAALWVGDPVPRAQAFYRRHGFVADGSTRVEDGVRSIRMLRG
ncbi:Ribosomal protein S18 acetylase RimI [Rathayibacter oskolensis]|uniref:Ribosomal protein S18 acetylase RimI n=1 Tax=Rathayibacter oskolensis TaxID=1891671 RepID=A0A1X7N782_9MICO|nr:GNAT family N-acetyltransferase [Rathayibacter oskolensis]SMH32479.1 Ribosomal protein S18 acetylase RimI [Rathayibacter oskolensis]